MHKEDGRRDCGAPGGIGGKSRPGPLHGKQEAPGKEGYLSLRCFFTLFFFLRRGEELPQLRAKGGEVGSSELGPGRWREGQLK